MNEARAEAQLTSVSTNFEIYNCKFHEGHVYHMPQNSSRSSNLKATAQKLWPK